jgi:Rhodopirellula transposase DDE domain
MPGESDLVATIREKFRALGAFLDERARRRWAATESRALGHGGDQAVWKATGIARATIRKGRAEIEADVEPGERLREPGAGRPSLEQDQPGIHAALEALVDPVTRGDPESPLRWTSKSKAKLTAELRAQGWTVSATSVGRMLHALGFSLQALRKTLEGTKHPDRNAQFEHINATADEFLQRGQPVISVDTKKKELVGEFKNGGQEWQPEGTPEKVQTHDFPTDAVGKAIPYGVYDIARNEAFVGVGCDHDTPAFAVATIRLWWAKMGSQAYPEAKELFITADAGGSNSYRARAWKVELQKLADDLGLAIRVSHFPPGTSKWNKIEHRLFSYITLNWRGRPLRTFETVVQLIGNTRTTTGLRVRAKLDKRKYPTGVTIPKAVMKKLSLHTHEFHGDWNYALWPRAKASALINLF